MADNSLAGQSPYEAWNKLLENTLKWYPGTPATQAIADTTKSQEGKSEQDPWMALIDQLWDANPYLANLDPAGATRLFQQFWLRSLSNPTQAWTDYANFMQQYTQIWTNAALKFWGLDKDQSPVIEPEKGDKRFSAPDWQENPAFDAIKQSYLLTATTLLKEASEKDGFDEKQQRKLIFYMRQFLDAISPTNFFFTNPEVLHETLKSGGRNLVKGMENFMRDLQAGQIKMVNTDAFAPGRNLAITPGQVVYRNELIELIQYTPTTNKVYAIPLLFMPPWINKYYVLDMQPHNSLIRFLVDNGFTVFVVSWKNPDASMEGLGFDDYLTLGPLSAIEVIKQITGSPKVNAIGYCIGGTLLAIALSYMAVKGDESVNSATFLVSLVDFKEVGDTGVFMDEPQLDYIESQMKQRGYLASNSMSAMFNMLRANDLIWSNFVNNYLLGKEPPAFDLLYWNSDGTRMTRTAHTFYLRNTYLENNLIKPNKIVVKGVPIDLGKIREDIYAVGTQQDHIVPWQSAWQLSQRVSGKVRFVLGGSGHIAGVIDPPSKGRGYWTNDKPANNAEQWFESAEQHEGSWWLDWLEWLKERSDEQVPPPSVGNEKYPLLTPAPGKYVLEK